MKIKCKISGLITCCLVFLVCNQALPQSSVVLPLSKDIKVFKHITPGDGDSVVDYSYYIDSICLGLEEFDKNGKPIYWQTYISKFQENGLNISWYPNGQINSICNYINGQRIGVYVQYYDNGKLKEKGNYWINQQGDTLIFNNIKVDTVPDEHGNMRVVVSSGKDLKDGEWVYYSEKGVLIRKEKYFHGKLIQSFNYSDK